MIKKLILAALAGSVVQFLLGWLIYGVLLASIMGSCTTQFEGLMKDMNSASFMILVFFSGLAMSFMLAFIFQRWAKFEKFLNGLTAGMFLGFFLALTYDLFSIASMNLLTPSALIIDVITNTIVIGIVGGVIACVLGTGSKKAPAE